MIAGWRMTVIYETRCIVCGAVDQQRYTMLPHLTFPRPGYPEGWHTYDSGTICPQHSMVIEIRDAEPPIVKLEVGA